MIQCWLIRRRLRRQFDGADAPRADVEEHLRICKNCRRFYEAESTVTRRLRDESEVVACETPTCLHRNIMRRIHADRPPLQSASFHRFPSAAIGAAAVAVFAIGFFGLSMHHQRQAAKSAQSKTPGMMPNDLWVQVRRIAPQLQSDEVFGKWTLSLNHPLEAEAQALFQDAQAAIHLLSANFLPSTAEK